MADGGMPHELPLAELCRRCRDETDHYHRREEFEARYCIEIFRRAIVGRDEACWTELRAIYKEQLVVWCRRAAANAAFDIDDVEAAAWVKFWRHYTAEKLADATGIAGVLAYLKTCVYSAVIDITRHPARGLPLEKAESAPDPRPGPEQEYAETDESAEFWLVVNRHLTDERERMLLQLKYVLRLKPADILRQYPDLFSTVDDIYRLTRNILERLRRSPEMRRWLDREKE
jgi:hypothetical protein